jgi:rare lipoprotein A
MQGGGLATRAIRGDVPLPEGRPYSLGNTSMDVASVSATSEVSASRSSRTGGRTLARNQHAVSYDNYGNYAAAEPRSVQNEPAARGDDQIGSLLSARGLY